MVQCSQRGSAGAGRPGWMRGACLRAAGHRSAAGLGWVQGARPGWYWGAPGSRGGLCSSPAWRRCGSSQLRSCCGWRRSCTLCAPLHAHLEAPPQCPLRGLPLLRAAGAGQEGLPAEPARGGAAPPPGPAAAAGQVNQGTTVTNATGGMHRPGGGIQQSVQHLTFQCNRGLL